MRCIIDFTYLNRLCKKLKNFVPGKTKFSRLTRAMPMTCVWPKSESKSLKWNCKS